MTIASAPSQERLHAGKGKLGSLLELEHNSELQCSGIGLLSRGWDRQLRILKILQLCLGQGSLFETECRTLRCVLKTVEILTESDEEESGNSRIQAKQQSSQEVTIERNRERAAKNLLLGPQSTKGEAGSRGLHTSDPTVNNEVLWTPGDS